MMSLLTNLKLEFISCHVRNVITLIGKTIRNLSIVWKEHFGNIKNGEIEKSAVVARGLAYKHRIKKNKRNDKTVRHLFRGKIF